MNADERPPVKIKDSQEVQETQEPPLYRRLYRAALLMLKNNEAVLRQVMRYDRFNAEGMSPREWEKYIGSTANGYDHHRRVLDGTNAYIAFHEGLQDGGRGDLDGFAPTELSDVERIVLKITALTHDIPERIHAKIGHDIETDKHTDKTRREEDAEFGVLVEELISLKDEGGQPMFSQHEVELIENLFPHFYRGVADDGDPGSKLHNIFKQVIERVDHMGVAMRIFVGLPSEEGDSQRIENWTGLVGNVLSNQIVPLLERSKKDAFTYDFLSENAGLISRMFVEVREAGAPVLATDDKPSFDIEKFTRAYIAWNDWVMNRPWR